MRNLALFFLLFVSTRVECAQVLRVGSSQKILAISHEDFRQFRVRDYVCVTQDGRDVACGTVLKVTPKAAIVKLDSRSQDVARGDRVRLAPSGRKPAMALLDSVGMDESSGIFHNNLSGGISAGINFFFPTVNYQHTVSSEIALGVLPTFFAVSVNDTSVKALGGYLTGNYYGNEYFRGMWIQGGPGLFYFDTVSGEIQESGTAFAFLATAGWRGYWDLGFNIGVAAGFQYIQEPNIGVVEIRSSGFQPLVVLDVGFNF